ncbi:MAG: hypothetical protein KGS61_21320, partial [Verrucomicrobia bacterium]|nr:hypothetical protein [Verrucomicrobiota bacterium]
FIQSEDYQAALRRLDVALRDLLGLGCDSVAALADGEILARLTLGEPTPFVQEKCLVLAALLKQLGRVCAAQQRTDESRECFLKALHLIVGTELQNPSLARPDYAPTVEELVEQLRPQTLPPRTWGALVVLYEQRGQFGKAEDALFSLLEASAGNVNATEMGIAFYRRLQGLSDEVLAAGGLPRPEVVAGLEEILRAHPPKT